MASRPKEEREFVKLNSDKTTILAVLKTDPSFVPPRPMNPNRPLSNRYCDYHEDTGHTTERCYQLANLIEDKIKNGELLQFVQNEEFRKFPGKESERIIDVISGGLSEGGASNNLKNSYAREVFRIDSKKPRRNSSPVISFSDADYSSGLIEGNQDALVITA